MIANARWTGYRAGDPEYRRIVIALFAAGFATFAQLYSTQALMPMISADLDIPAYTAGLSISMATGGLGLSVLGWAALADRHGRTAIMKASALIAAVIGLIVPFMPSWDLILGLRLLEGMALGALPGLAMAYLSEEINHRYLAIVSGVFVSGNTIGGLSGRIIAGLVGDFAGWRVGLFAVSFCCAIAAAAFFLVSPEPRGFVPTAERIARGATVTPPLTRLREALTKPKLWAVYTIGFCGMGAFVSMYSYIGYPLAQPPYSLPAAVTSLIFLVYLVGTVASRIAGKLAFRWGSRYMIAAGFTLMGIGALLTLVPNLIATFIGLATFTYGFFTLNPIAAALTSRFARHAHAQASALYQLFYYAGSAFLGWLVGILMVASGWQTAVAGILAAVASGIVIALMGLRNLPHSDATSQMPVIHSIH